MKKKQFAMMVAVVLLLSTFAGAGGMQNAFASTLPASVDNGIIIVTFSTDKDVYTAREEMEIFLSVYSPESISNALITLKFQV
ncbi:MAG: hypothetical protein U9O85_05440 [Euryarchaeota archaeon]|nr:hypothetical protein [Euryarchaeota archaeon]